MTTAEEFGPREVRKRSGLKAVLGVVIGAVVVLVVGYVAVLALGLKEAEKENERAGITASQFQSVDVGATRKQVESTLGKPGDAQALESRIPASARSAGSCIYYPESGQGLFNGKVFQLCFDDGRLTSKHAH